MADVSVCCDVELVGASRRGSIRDYVLWKDMMSGASSIVMVKMIVVEDHQKS